MTKNQKKPEVSSLAGWSDVFRQQTIDHEEREAFRKEQAKQIIETSAKLPLEGRMIVLFTSVEANILTNREFFEEAHKALGMPPLE